MKFIVNGLELSNAVSKVIKAVSTKTTNAVLEGIKLSVKGDELILTATDIEIAIEKTIKVDTFTEGDVLVPGKIFYEYVKKIENEEEIEISEEDNKIKLNYSSSEGYIQLLNVEEFPIINKEVKEKAFSIIQKDFKELILKSVFACSQDEARPLLKGCLLEIEEDTISSVALDGFRLAITKKKIKESTGNLKIIVNQRTLSEIIRLLDKDDEIFSIKIQKNILKCEVEGTVLIARLLEGEYINYKDIIKNSFSTQVNVNREMFLNAIERASVIATDLKRIIKVEIKENYMDISASSEIGKTNENIIINLEGKDLIIAFNSKFLSDAVKVIDDEYINLYFNSKIDPCIIKPLSGDDYLYLILPLRINA